MRRRAAPIVLAVAALAGAVGCGSGGGTATSATTGTTPAAAPAAAQESPAVRLAEPTAGTTLHAHHAPDGTLHAQLAVRGTAVANQTLRIQLSCPGRSCTRFVLSDDAGAFAATMDVALPATLSRLTVGADYATIPDPRTAASLKVSIHRPRTPAPRRTSSRPREQEPTTPSNPATTPTIPAPTTAETPTPAGTRRTMTVIGDSLAVGMKPYLGSVLPGWTVTVDGRVGRPLAEGMSILNSTSLPSGSSSVLAISLFTNDDPRNTTQLSSAIDTTLHAVGSTGCVIWATISRDPVGGISYNAANDLLARKASANPHLRIADWATYVTTHPGTLSSGNVHPGPAGYRARAALYAQAASGCP
jgi:hypothetical protein